MNTEAVALIVAGSLQRDSLRVYPRSSVFSVDS